jgi:hypothetical protein
VNAVAVLLAAGAGTRMGGPKALLRLGAPISNTTSVGKVPLEEKYGPRPAIAIVAAVFALAHFRFGVPDPIHWLWEVGTDRGFWIRLAIALAFGALAIPAYRRLPQERSGFPVAPRRTRLPSV